MLFFRRLTPIQLICESAAARSSILPATLIGVLANCNKFEVYNPYQAKIGQLSDDVALQQLTEAIAEACIGLRDSYIAVQDDTPKPWSLGGTLSYVGLGPLAGKKTPPPALSEEDAKTRFAEL